MKRPLAGLLLVVGCGGTHPNVAAFEKLGETVE